MVSSAGQVSSWRGWACDGGLGSIANLIGFRNTWALMRHSFGCVYECFQTYWLRRGNLTLNVAPLSPGMGSWTESRGGRQKVTWALALAFPHSLLPGQHQRQASCCGTSPSSRELIALNCGPAHLALGFFPMKQEEILFLYNSTLYQHRIPGYFLCRNQYKNTIWWYSGPFIHPPPFPVGTIQSVRLSIHLPVHPSIYSPFIHLTIHLFLIRSQYVCQVSTTGQAFC